MSELDIKKRIFRTIPFSPPDISEAENYYKEHKNLNIKATYTTKSGVKLGSWIVNIRTYKKDHIQRNYLTKERIDALNKLGMVWDVPDYVWEQNYAACVEYHREHGDLDIPHDYVSKDGLKIGSWVRRQRALRQGKAAGTELTEDQIQRLDAIDMLWADKYSRAWETAYQEAKVYYEEHGNLDVPLAYVTASGFKLGRWISNRRVKRKEAHSKERQEQLDRIGMIWKRPDSWETRFNLAKAYYAEHGNLRVPAEYKAEGVWLNKWLNEQRQIYLGKRKGKALSGEQVQRLCAIGMCLENGNQQIQISQHPSFSLHSTIWHPSAEEYIVTS